MIGDYEVSSGDSFSGILFLRQDVGCPLFMPERKCHFLGEHFTFCLDQTVQGCRSGSANIPCQTSRSRYVDLHSEVPYLRPAAQAQL